MIQSIQTYLSKFGQPDKKILKAIEKIDRKNFVLSSEKAYLDTALLTKKAQTISQPSTVARMLSLLDLKKSDKVLEIGTGSGWNAALISYLIKPGKVLTLEYHRELADFAKNNISKLKIKNIEIQTKSYLDIKNKFNKIIFTAGIIKDQEKQIQKYAKTHLKENGILLCPFRHGPLIIIKKTKQGIKKTYTPEEYVFVPLV